MGRYTTEHTVVDVSIVPFFPRLAKKSVIKDQITGKKAEGYDWNSYEKAEAKAWEKLQQKNSPLNFEVFAGRL